MTGETKITLSDAELAIVQETEWILTKHRIFTTVFSLFNDGLEGIKESISQNKNLAMPEILSAIPKIYKGENYRLFPYVIMDYPAVFSKQNIFALRAMFWWGHFFSITLVISGKYKEAFGQNILSKLKNAPGCFYICVNEDEWEHNFDTENFIEMADASIKIIEKILDKTFLKIALRYPLTQWNDMPALLKDGYDKIIKLMED